MKSNSLISDAISQNGYIVQVIYGKSMWPLLRNKRDSVHIVYPNVTPKRGDIVLFIRDGEKNGHHVLHRIMRTSGDNYIICGDNQWKSELVRPNMIVGIAEGIYRDEKYISLNDSLGYKIYRFFCMLFYPIRKPIFWLRDYSRIALGRVKKIIFKG